MQGVYQFFSAGHEGNTLNIYDPNGGVLKQVNFPRQSDGEELCAAEFVGPVEKNPRDSIAMFAVTSGNQIRALAQKFKEEGDFLNLMLFRHWQLRLAEGFAEYLHQK